jgi:hypothetical protein
VIPVGRAEDGDQVQHTLLTDGTAFEVDAGDAEQEFSGGLWRRHGRRRVGQEHAALSEGAEARRRLASRPTWRMRTMPAGTAWSGERRRNLSDLELHDFDAVAVSIVAPAEGDAGYIALLFQERKRS